MCMSKPKMPAITPPPPPPEVQEAKLPDMKAVRRKSSDRSAPIAGGTLLTGPSGVTNNQLPTAGGSLLGG